MSLGTKQPRAYLNLKDGRIRVKKSSGDEIFYDYIEGKLVDISHRPREFNGETVEYWYLDIQVESGTIYSLSLHYSSGVAKSIFNALASAETLGTIKLETYQSNGFTKAVVYNNGEKLSWKYTEIPPIEEIQAGGKVVKDDTKRMEFFKGIAESIKRKIA